MEPLALIAGVATMVAGVIFIFIAKIQRTRAELEVQKLVHEAEKKRDQLLAKAREEARETTDELKRQVQAEKESSLKVLRSKEDDLKTRSQNLGQEGQRLKEQEQSLLLRQQQLNAEKQQLERSRTDLNQLVEREKSELLKISRMSRDEALALLLEKLTSEADLDAKAYAVKKLEAAKSKADEEAREIIVDAMQRLSQQVTSDNTTTAIHLPKDDLKGKIIGREGRNIRTFERVTGVDLIIDETPETITLSSFDSYRREIARRTLERLIADGRIHPGSIEEFAAKAAGEMDVETLKLAEQTFFEAGFTDIHPDIVKVFGKLRYRMSYGQNQLQHSLQVMELCDYMAQELKLDRKLARRCGLLHDIGKAVDKGTYGTHPALGYELAARCNEKPIVCNAIAAHHEGVEVTSIYTTLTAVADAISAARPGARRENTEKYFERMQKLEQVASAFPGVEKVYAMRAGREVRVSVEASKVSDLDGVTLTRDIARAIEKNVEYPGDVKVTLIRETRFVEFAR